MLTFFNVFLTNSLEPSQEFRNEQIFKALIPMLHTHITQVNLFFLSLSLKFFRYANDAKKMGPRE